MDLGGLCALLYVSKSWGCICIFLLVRVRVRVLVRVLVVIPGRPFKRKRGRTLANYSNASQHGNHF